MDERIPDDEYRRLQDENAKVLDHAIEALERQYGIKWHEALLRAMALPRVDDEIGFPDMWRDVKAVQNLFNVTKPVERETREHLWIRFNDFRDRSSAAHDAYRVQMEKLLDDNSYEVCQALVQLEIDFSLGDDNEVNEGRPDLKGFSAAAEKVQALLKAKRLRHLDREELWIGLNKLWAKVKQIRDLNQSDWQNRQHDLVVRIELDIEKDQEYRKSLFGRIENAEGFMDRLHANIVNDQAFLPRLQQQIIELEEQRDSAWSDTFFANVSFRIEEKKKKILEVEAQIVDRQAKLEDVPVQIEGYRQKIELVDKQIEERRERIRDIRARLDDAEPRDRPTAK